jgi:hypothetical protein
MQGLNHAFALLAVMGLIAWAVAFSSASWLLTLAERRNGLSLD